jgi:hypothetical protein
MLAGNVLEILMSMRTYLSSSGVGRFARGGFPEFLTSFAGARKTAQNKMATDKHRSTPIAGHR